MIMIVNLCVVCSISVSIRRYVESAGLALEIVVNLCLNLENECPIRICVIHEIKLRGRSMFETRRYSWRLFPLKYLDI